MTLEEFIGTPELARLRSTAIAKDDSLRSAVLAAILNASPSRPPRQAVRTPAQRLVQFWDSRVVPDDVQECLDTWRPIEAHGIQRVLFDDERARQYIAQNFGRAHSLAFDRCRHPAMRCDYFRLCYVVREGGMYVDADDVYLGGDPAMLFRDDALLVNALCYDCKTDSMVPSQRFVGRDHCAEWTYYVNNNPLIAPAGHPVLRLALARATRALLALTEDRPDIQSTTGPGNLTACLVQHAVALARRGKPLDFVALTDWDSFAVTRWPLAYRRDDRNWRVWRRPA
jgi:hypothetical protein